jgi:phenylacetate-CoA ligase
MWPIFARFLYFGLQFLRGEPVQAALADVRRTEFWSLEQLRQLQASRMREQLQFALQHVPNYRDSLLPFSSRIFQTKKDDWLCIASIMDDLPFISKDDVQRDYNLFLSHNAELLPTYPDKTSGSTGTPLVFPCDQRAWAYRHALVYRNMEMHNVHIGEPYALFFGLHWDKKARQQVALRDWVFNRVRVSAFDIGRKTFDMYLRKIRFHHPAFFLGYPSALYDFCHLAQEFGIDLRDLKLKAVFTTAEPLWTYQRELIQETTGCKCVNSYGSAEGGYTAFECPDGNLHLHVETCWLRLLNSSERTGEALVTDMMLRAFPLINYGIEDEISLGNDTCSCGRAHPIIHSINGRSGEPIHLPNGNQINANLPSYIFKPLASLRVVRRYRFLLQGNDLKLFLVVSENFNDEHIHLIDHETRCAFGEDIQYTTHIVSELEPLANAKHKCFVVIPETHDG